MRVVSWKFQSQPIYLKQSPVDSSLKNEQNSYKEQSYIFYSSFWIMAILVAEKVPILNGKRIFLQSRPNEMKFSVRIPDTLIMIPRDIKAGVYWCLFVASLFYLVFTIFQ